MVARTVATGGSEQSHRTLPRWLARYTDLALVGLVAGTVLALFALVTNPVPDPSFPWFTLPPSARLPFVQPRIEHWPVSYTLGVWAWILGFPALFLEGYRRFESVDALVWLGWLPVVAMLAWTTYCRFFWPKLHPPTWNAPSYTLVCWLYCSTYDPVWSNLAYAIGIGGIAAVLVGYRTDRLGDIALGTFGVLALPLGLPAIFGAYRRFSSRRSPAGERVRGPVDT